MRDSELVASIVAGDPEGLAEAYDRYADPIYKYCRSMLSQPGDTANAVQDTFIIAAYRLHGLHDPARLRAWLYAVARNEALRILRARTATPTVDEAPDVTDESADVGGDAEHAELRALLEDAVAGLNPGEREAVELQLRQGLDPAEVAGVLGVSDNHAHALLSRAREQLQACLGVLLVGRAGRGDCRELGRMLAGWDGRLTVASRKRIHRHIERCQTCTARRSFELRPAVLLGVSSYVALAGAGADSLRLAAGPPAALKAHTLTLAASHSPGAIAHRGAVLARAGSFGRHGFPRPVPAPKAGSPRPAAGKGALRSVPPRQTAVAAGVALTVVVAATAFALAGNAGHVSLADDQSLDSPPAARPTAQTVVPLPSAGKSSAAVAQAVPSPRKPGPSRTKARAQSTAAATAPSPPPATVNPAPTPTPTAWTPSPTPTPTTASPTPTPTWYSPSPTPSPSPSPTPSPSPPPPPPPPPPPIPSPSPSPTSPAPAVLVVSPAGGQLVVPPRGTTITLTAEGGPVDWSISVSWGHGFVGVMPFFGTLQDGQSQTVMIFASPRAFGRQLTVSPGGTVFTIVIGGGGPFAEGTVRNSSPQ